MIIRGNTVSCEIVYEISLSLFTAKVAINKF